MNRKEFAAAVNRLNTSPWHILINDSADGAMQRGCYLENGIWKVFENDAKGIAPFLMAYTELKRVFPDDLCVSEELMTEVMCR